MKNKIIMGVLCLAVFFLMVGCNGKNKKNETSNDVKTESVKKADNGEKRKKEKKEEEETELDKLQSRNYKLKGYTIITPYVQIILTSDGKVLAKGENTYGQLGNGKRIDSESWSKVVGLENVVGIYSLGNIGNDVSDENGYGHCYALNSSGELYRWGGNILKPEKVELFSKIKEVKSLTSYELFVKCESGEKYIITRRFNEDNDDSIYSYNSLPDSAEIYGYGDAFIVCNNDEVSFVDAPDLVTIRAFGEILPLEDKIKNIIPVDISEKIEDVIPCRYKGFGGATIMTEEGSVLVLSYQNGKMEVKDMEGIGVKKASFNATDVLLAYGGTISTRGDNEYGQLGDGTTDDYKEGFLEIEETNFEDFEYDGLNEYCIALDEEYNVWGWGKGIGSSPSIIVEQSDFLN